MNDALLSIEVAIKCGHTAILPGDHDIENFEGFCEECQDYSLPVMSYDDRGAWDLDDLKYLLGDVENETIEF